MLVENSTRYLNKPTHDQLVHMVRRLVAAEMDLDRAVQLVAEAYHVKKTNLHKWIQLKQVK